MNQDEGEAMGSTYSFQLYRGEDTVQACQLALGAHLHHASEEYLLRPMMQLHLDTVHLFTTIAIAFRGSLPVGIMTYDKLYRVTVYVRASERRKGLGVALWEMLARSLGEGAPCAYGESEASGKAFWGAMSARHDDAKRLRFGPYSFSQIS